MRFRLFFVFFILLKTTYSQVAVNTQSPSTSAVLHLEALDTDTMEFGGFLFPIVTEAQQLAIPVSTVDMRDEALMVYVNDLVTGKRCLDIYDAVDHVWRSIYCFSTCGTTPIYEEDFSTYVTNTGITGLNSNSGDYPSGVTKWTLSSYSTARDGNLDYPGTLDDMDDYALVKAGRLEFQDTNGPLLFETQAIDISSFASINFSLEISESGDMEYNTIDHVDDFNCGEASAGNDYVDFEYSTDGGTTYTEIPNFSGLGTSDHTLHDDLPGTVTVTKSNLSGTSLIIRVRLQNWAGDERYFLDNVLVTCN